MEVVLPKTIHTRGAILVYQLKSIDFTHRHAEFIEKLPPKIIEQVLEIAQLIVA